MANHVSRVLLIGLDGATWNVIHPLVKQGKLPAFQHIMENGAYGDLRSLEWSVSPRVWTSIATGKSEDKHGILDFYNTVKDLKATRIWDVLIEKKGETANIFYWYLTWPPPKNFKKVMVPGFLARDSRTIPAELSFIKDLEITQKMKMQESYDPTGFTYYMKQAFNAWRNGLKFSTMLRALSFLLERKLGERSELDSFYKVMFLKFHIHTDVFLNLLKKEPTDFSAIMIPQPDQLGHKYWHFMDPDDFEKRTGTRIKGKEQKKYGSVIPDAYHKIDRFLARICQTLEENDLLIVLSDHGFGPVKEVYSSLRVKSQPFLNLLGLERAAHCVSLGFSYFIQIDDETRLSEISQIMKKIESITVFDSGLKLFEAQIQNEREIVIKIQKLVLMSPEDAHEFLSKKIKFEDKILNADEIFVSRADITGEHEPLGILMMMGKNIKKHQKIKERSVFDIVPTILYMKGLAVAKDMDGIVIKQAIVDEYLEKNPIQFIDTYEPEEGTNDFGQEDFSMTEELENRLERLGYL